MVVPSSWLGTLAKEQSFLFLCMKNMYFNSKSLLLVFPQPDLQERATRVVQMCAGVIWGWSCHLRDLSSSYCGGKIAPTFHEYWEERNIGHLGRPDQVNTGSRKGHLNTGHVLCIQEDTQPTPTASLALFLFFQGLEGSQRGGAQVEAGWFQKSHATLKRHWEV